MRNQRNWILQWNDQRLLRSLLFNILIWTNNCYQNFYQLAYLIVPFFFISQNLIMDQSGYAQEIQAINEQPIIITLCFIISDNWTFKSDQLYWRIAQHRSYNSYIFQFSDCCPTVESTKIWLHQYYFHFKRDLYPCVSLYHYLAKLIKTEIYIYV